MRMLKNANVLAGRLARKCAGGPQLPVQSANAQSDKHAQCTVGRRASSPNGVEPSSKWRPGPTLPTGTILVRTSARNRVHLLCSRCPPPASPARFRAASSRAGLLIGTRRWVNCDEVSDEVFSEKFLGQPK